MCGRGFGLLWFVSVADGLKMAAPKTKQDTNPVDRLTDRQRHETGRDVACSLGGVTYNL